MSYSFRKKITIVLSFLSLFISCYCIGAPGGLASKASLSNPAATLLFTENRGQVADNAGHLRPDILFTAHSAGTQLYLTATGIYYQFTKVTGDVSTHEKQATPKTPTETQTYRFSMTLAGSNPNPAIRRESKNAAIENFYLPQCPDGITDVATYEKLVYENVYPGIDWVVYNNEGHLKYDFIVRPGGDPAQIKLGIKDARDVSITGTGELLMTTTLGEVREHAPVSYAAGKNVPTKFKKNADGTIGFDIAGIPAGTTLTIDPSVSWATYYGGADVEKVLSTATDASGNVYLTGSTSSTTGIASAGAFQTALSGSQDAYIAKFTASGTLLWATYYGSGTGTYFQCCVTDGTGNVYAAGETVGTTGIATTGAYQTSYGGGEDAMIVKFSSTGARLWGTYYGGASTEDLYGCALDASGNLFVVGSTYSLTGISTPGAYQTATGGGGDMFIAKFNASGTSLLWGTYFGGINSDQARCCVSDASGNVYIGGFSSSTSGIATPGAYQTTLSGTNSDGVVAKFSGAGSLLWATYYGGTGTELIVGCSADGSDNVYFVGSTNSTSGISTPGAIQAAYGGGISNGFIAKLNPSGSSLLWGTYYGGGSSNDQFDACTLDAGGSLYAAGTTSATSGIASGGFQDTYGGGTSNAMVAAVTSSGSLLWASYFGSTGSETGTAIAASPGSLYLGGVTTSASGIATTGAYQSVIGGGADGYLVRIDVVVITTGTITPTLCAGSAISVPYTATGTFPAGNVFTAQLSDATGSFLSPVTIGTVSATASGTVPAIIPPATAGGTHYRIRVVSSAPAYTGTDNGSDITIAPRPVVGVITGTLTVCVASTTALADTPTHGAWSTGAATIATVGSTGIVTGVSGGTVTISYSVTNDCGPTVATAVVTVNPLPVPVITAAGLLLSTTLPYSTYQWITGSTAIAGATNATYLAPGYGTYSVKVTGSNGCVATSASKIKSVGVQNTQAGNNEVIIYPNPTTGVIYVQAGGSTDIDVLGINGKLLLSLKDVAQIDISSLPAGLYVVNVYDRQHNLLKSGKLTRQ